MYRQCVTGAALGQVMGGLLSAHVLAQDGRFMTGYNGALLDKALDLGRPVPAPSLAGRAGNGGGPFPAPSLPPSLPTSLAP